MSARSWRLIAALGFWALIAAAITLRGTFGLVLAYAAAIWLGVFSLLAWRRQDEYTRAAQKFSWMFGGLVGLFISFAFLPVLLQPQVLGQLLSLIGSMVASPYGFSPYVAAVLLGATWVVAGQLVGFLACWVGWHVSKR